MKKRILIALLVLLCGSLVFADDANKIPLEFANTILKIQLDEADLRTQMTQMQARYQHDEEEITTTKERALYDAKKDPKEWDVDSAKLEFVGKAKAAPAAAPAKK